MLRGRWCCYATVAPIRVTSEFGSEPRKAHAVSEGWSTVSVIMRVKLKPELLPSKLSQLVVSKTGSSLQEAQRHDIQNDRKVEDD